MAEPSEPGLMATLKVKFYLKHFLWCNLCIFCLSIFFQFCVFFLYFWNFVFFVFLFFCILNFCIFCILIFLHFFVFCIFVFSYFFIFCIFGILYSLMQEKWKAVAGVLVVLLLFLLIGIFLAVMIGGDFEFRKYFQKVFQLWSSFL